ncbi:hypothetical protein [Arsenicibacter rosenii]|uniref:Uncharacterized protein n=1 Tax=Arsenicibacter rosenii TaxID=1750698 RepID=A0A1S2VQD0_9BACT|nr:hypothetical protein [Arsenicibacter rosenii]OIN60425.1 hypothetical protein BLX24_06280 [Arsenicibacter rosenii]
MLRDLSTYLYKIASWKTLLLGGLLYVPFPAYFLSNLEAMINRYAGQPIGPIDLLLFNTEPARILDMVDMYGTEGRQIYAEGELIYDTIYPLTYTFLLCILLSAIYKNRTVTPFDLVNIVPFLFLWTDYLENICIITLLRTHPDTSLTVAAICAILSAVKWGGFFVSLVLILYGLLRRFFVRPVAQPAR